MGGRPDGNRQDNRQRGNAAQLLEKYPESEWAKKARDKQKDDKPTKSASAGAESPAN